MKHLARGIALAALISAPAFAADKADKPTDKPAAPQCTLPDTVTLSLKALSFLQQSAFNPEFKKQISMQAYTDAANDFQNELLKQCKKADDAKK